MTEPPFEGGASGPDETFEAMFPADTAAIPSARRQSQNSPSTAGPEGVVGNAAPVCDESRADAAVHDCRDLPPATEAAVTAGWCAGRLRVSVCDPARERPGEYSDSVSRPSGHGPKLVGAFCAGWGVGEDLGAHGKNVRTTATLRAGGLRDLDEEFP